MRPAAEDFQRRLEAATTAATTALRRGQHAAGEETRRRIREIFRLAALQGGDTWDRLQKGALVSEPGPGDDVLAMFAPGGARLKDSSAERAEAQRTIVAAQKAAHADAGPAEEEAARLTAQAKKAQRAVTRRRD